MSKQSYQQGCSWSTSALQHTKARLGTFALGALAQHLSDVLAKLPASARKMALGAPNGLPKSSGVSQCFCKADTCLSKPGLKMVCQKQHAEELKRRPHPVIAGIVPCYPPIAGF